LLARQLRRDRSNGEKSYCRA